MICKVDSSLKSSNKKNYELHTISRLLMLNEREVPTYTIPSLPALHVAWTKYCAYERESHQGKHKVVVPPIVWCGIEQPCWLVSLST